MESEPGGAEPWLQPQDPLDSLSCPEPSWAPNSPPALFSQCLQFPKPSGLGALHLAGPPSCHASCLSLLRQKPLWELISGSFNNQAVW